MIPDPCQLKFTLSDVTPFTDKDADEGLPQDKQEFISIKSIATSPVKLFR